MTRTMEALVYVAPGEMAIRRVPVPRLDDSDVLIRVRYSGICGSELSGFLGKSSIRTPPLIFGHEVSGVVEEVGSGVLSVAAGERVTVNPLLTCGHCRYCESGHEQLCLNRRLLGASVPGSNADLVSVPESAVHRVASQLSMEHASMVEPLAFALRATEVTGDVTGTTVLVIGAGAIGLFLIQALKIRRVERVLVAEVNPERLAMAVALGAHAVPLDAGSVSDWVRDQCSLGVPVAIDAVGTEATRRLALECVSPGGTVVLAGLHSDESTLPLNTLVRSELSIRGAFAYGKRHFAEAVQLMTEGQAGLDDGVVIAPLSEGQHWFQRLVAGDSSSKVLLSPLATEVGAVAGVGGR